MANEYEYKDTPMLSKVKIGNTLYYLKDAEARTAVDTILADYLTSTDKTELLAADAALSARIEALEEEGLIARVETLETEVGIINGDATTEGSIKKAVADEATARDAAITEAIEDLDVTDAEVSGQYVSAVSETDGKITVTRKALPTAAEYTMVKQATAEEKMAATYYLTKDGTQVGAKINIPKDQFLKEAHFCKDSSEVPSGHTAPAGTEFPAILFIFTTAAGDVDTWVSVKDLVDVYTAGDGIDITNNVVSAKVKTGETYLEVTNDGLATKGIDTAIATAVATETTRATEVEEGLDSRLTTAEGEIDALQGAAHTHTNKTELDLIATGDKAKWDEAVSDLADEITRATAEEADIRSDFAEADALKADKVTGATNGNFAGLDANGNLTDSGKKASDFATAADLTALSDRVDTAEDDIDDIKAKEAGWDAKLDNVKLSGNFLPVKSDVAGKGNYVDLGSIATTDGVVANVSYEDATHTIKQQKGELTSSIHQFGDLADENLANLEVKGQTISGVKATGTTTGELTGELDYTSTVLTSNGQFTAEGTIDVTLAGNTFNAITSVGTLPTKAADSWTANTPTAIDTTKFNGGSQASFTQGSKANLTTANISYVEAGVEVEVGTGDDAECLIFTNLTAKTAKAVDTFTANGDDSFTANTVASLGDGFYTAGTAAQFSEGAFSQGTLPAMESNTVSVATKTFTGTANQPISVAGNYDKANIGTVAFSGADIELDVGDITIADKAVTKKSV